MIFGYVEHKCINCGILHWIPQSLEETMIATKNNSEPVEAYCPYGHPYVKKSGNKLREEEQTRLERDRLRQQLAQRDDLIREEREKREAAERSAKAYKGSATRVKNRAKHGVCPCCNRTFKQLAQHMKTKHPHFQPDVNVIELAKKVRNR